MEESRRTCSDARLGRPLVAELLSRCTFPAAGPVVCAVSGGADSTALAVLAVAAGLAPTLVHVDHGLRPGSDLEADRVRRLGGTLGVEVECRRVEVSPGPDLERRARDARREALGAGALLGHTADDLAETVLLHLLRGTGPEGIVSMATGSRPLLALRRAETLALCAELGLGVLDDPMNADPAFTRVRVRHELIPLMNDVSGRDVVPLLARYADHQRVLLDLVEPAVTAVDPTDCAALARAHPAAARAALRRWVRATTGAAHGPDAAATDRLLAVATNGAPRHDVGGGWSVARTGGRLRLERTAAAEPPTQPGGGALS